MTAVEICLKKKKDYSVPGESCTPSQGKRGLCQPKALHGAVGNSLG